MLLISVEVLTDGDKRRVLGQARIANISNLADVSDCAVYAEEGENKLAGAKEWNARGVAEDHDRRQTVWALVQKVAAWAASQAPGGVK